MKRLQTFDDERYSAAKKNLEPLHRFHPFCARFPSEVAEAAIKSYSRIGDNVFDPFCGSGTSLVAGLVHGRRVVGADIDTLAGILTEVKCSVRHPAYYRRWRKEFAAKLNGIFAEIECHWSPSITPRPGSSVSVGSLVLRVPAFPQLSFWFPPQLTTALAGIAEAAHSCRDPHYEKVALISLSACIIAKWPNTLSYAMDIDHTRAHRRIQRFHLARVLEVYLERLDRTVSCLGSLYETYSRAAVAKKLHGLARVVCPHDARKALPDMADDSQALVITSPPYFNAVDYPRAHRLAVCWMNGHAPADLASRRDYIGLHRAAGFDAESWLSMHSGVRKLIPTVILDNESLGRSVAGFFADLDKVLDEMWRVLRPEGHVVLVIGDNMIQGKRIASHSALVELARYLGFSIREVRSRKIRGLRRRYPVGLFGFDGPMTHEFVIVLEKPSTNKPTARRESCGRNR